MNQRKFRIISLVMVLLLFISGCSNITTNSNSTDNSTSESINSQDDLNYHAIDTTIISKRNSNIPTTIFTPRELADKKYPLVLFSHGFDGSRKGFPGAPDELWLFEQMAIKLAEKGILSVMIDFPGCNESEEPSTLYTLNNMKDDMNSAIEYMNMNYNVDEENVALMGHSMGGRMVALQLSDAIKAAVLWTPAANTGLSGLYDFMGGENSVRELYEQAKIDGNVDLTIEPYTNLSLEFFKENEESDPLQSINNYKGYLFLAVALEDSAIYKTTTDKVIASAVNTKELEVINVENTSHIFTNVEDENDFSYQNYVVNQTTSFLIEKLIE